MAETAKIQRQTGQVIDLVRQALEQNTQAEIQDIIGNLHPADIAKVIEGLPEEFRESLWQQIDADKQSRVLVRMQDDIRAELLQALPEAKVISVTQEMDPDDAADLLQDLPNIKAAHVLNAMDEQYRTQLSSILSYPEDTAGGLMNTDVILIRGSASLGVVSRYLKQLGNIPDNTDKLIVVDRGNRYRGIMPLNDLLTCDPDIDVASRLIQSQPINADMSAREVAKLFEKREIISAAVVDSDNRLLGRITIDDVLSIIRADAEQIFRRIPGLGEESLFAPITRTIVQRTLWLGINLITAFVAAWVIGRFEHTIQQLVALAILMPVVAGMSGIAGQQTLTVTIRELALGRLAKTNTQTLIMKEVKMSLLNGLLWSFFIAIIAVIWFDNLLLGGVIGAAILINFPISALAGAYIPLVLKHYKIDPAVAGSVILTTITDVCSFMIFLGLGSFLLLST